MNLFNLLTEQGSQNPSGGAGNGYTMYIVFGIIIIAFIGMTIFQNKQRKKQQQADQEKKSKLCKGTKIVTIGGIIGTIVSVDQNDKTFVLDSEGSLMKFDMRAIYQMQLPEDAKVEEPVVEAPAVEEPATEAQEEVKE